MVESALPLMAKEPEVRQIQGQKRMADMIDLFYLLPTPKGLHKINLFLFEIIFYEVFFWF